MVAMVAIPVVFTVAEICRDRESITPLSLKCRQKALKPCPRMVVQGELQGWTAWVLKGTEHWHKETCPPNMGQDGESRSEAYRMGREAFRGL